MYVIRDIFQTHPGKAKDLVTMFKEARPHLLNDDIKDQRILTDVVADYWTVVIETEVDELGGYFNMAENPKVRESMTGYMDLIMSGHREIFKVA